jgi:hypothetical protein
MLFNGGIVPLYLLMLGLKLTNKIWSVILAYGMNNFYVIIMRGYYYNSRFTVGIWEIGRRWRMANPAPIGASAVHANHRNVDPLL